MSAGARTRVRTTHTFVELEVPAEVFDEIAERLRDADYDHVFIEDNLMDMQGIALKRKDDDGDSADYEPPED